jgi:hypothetical protein
MMIKRLERRITKIENAVGHKLDRSGFVAATQAQREVWIKLSKVPQAVELGRESAELLLAGVAKDAPEMVDLQQRLEAVWLEHYGSLPQ